MRTTLVVMPQAEKTTPTETAADPYAWEADPLVVVSRRARIFYFPSAVLLAAPTDAQRRRWLAEDSLPRDRADVQLVLNLGVTFLGCMTSKWLYRKSDDRQAPRSAPPADQCLLVEPQGQQARQAVEGAAFKDRETGRRRPDLVRAAWLRAVDFLRADDNPTSSFFKTTDGYDAPEVIVCKLSEVLRQHTEAGRHAYAHALVGADRCKDLVHLGALHDYAFREKSARPIVDACRRRALAVPENRL